ncbi:MAG: septum formation initiator family protein [bacterium]|nr:septum formation initiator family protein [bacterium]
MSRSHIQKILASKAVIFVAIPLILFVLYQLAIVMQKTFRTDKDIGALQKQITDLEKSQKRLQDFNEFLNTDFFAEKEARLKLGMQKKGEQVVVVSMRDVDSGSATADQSTQQQGGSQKEGVQVKSNQQAWWEYFFGS